MAKEVMVSVGYEGKQYLIPTEIARLNATQPGVAKAWIEEQIAEETDRRQQAKARREESVEAEFENISAKLSKVDGIEQAMAAMQQSVDAYASANAALNAQVAALEESGGVLGGANSSARQTAFELATQSTAGGAILSQMQSTQLSMERQLDSFQQQLDDFQLAIAKQVTEALTTGRQRGQLLQEASNRALDEAARAEEIARKAAATGAQALRDAAEAKIITKDQLTALDVENMVNDGINAGVTADRIADVVKQRFIPAMPNVDKMTIADLPDPVFAEKPSDNQMDREVKKALKRGKK